jgi:hypothetical protein
MQGRVVLENPAAQFGGVLPLVGIDASTAFLQV